MKKIRIKIIILLILPFIVFITACGDGFLDVKPDKRQRIPQSLEDYQAMLDDSFMNAGSSHLLGMIGGDEFTISDARWNSFPVGTSFYQKNAYIWESDSYNGSPVHDYHIPYQRILMLNVVLDGLKKYESSSALKSKAQALFLRARWYSELLQLFCPVYEEKNASNLLGLPMYLSSDITLKIKRSSLSETYGQIINDLKEASMFLPEKPSIIQRPSKAAACALLSRIYLQIGDYESSYYYSDQGLGINGQLLDYNKIDLSARYPFSQLGEGNPEILFMNMGGNLTITSTSYFNASEDLLSLYEADDLRKNAYFFNNSDGRVLFKGSYNGNYSFFTGFAVDEMYLTRAESSVRLGRVSEALNDLNYLRKHRILDEAYFDLKSEDIDQVLDWIIAERRKELVLRGVRWEDLRRLNKETRYQATMIREIGGKRYTLPHGDLRWTWKLPELAIDLGGYEQNVQ